MNRQERPSIAISRDAEIVALACFGMGHPQKLSFKRAHIITARARAALDELAAAGLLSVLDAHPGAAAWQATPAMLFPMGWVKPIEASESFDLTTE